MKQDFPIPKQIHEFADQYQQMYIQLGQYKSAYDILHGKLETNFDPPPYHTPVLVKLTYKTDPVVVFREKNATNDYYVVCFDGTHLRADNIESWIGLP